MRYENLELIRQKIAMSQKIVAQKDADYALYAGALFEEGQKMALIDVLLKHNLVPKSMVALTKFYRALLNQKRKAFLASTCSEIGKFGFILGLKDETINASSK